MAHELTKIVVPSKMNPVGAEGNVFAALFDQVPAKRAGNEDDIAGGVMYLVSRAGVSQMQHVLKSPTNKVSRHMLTAYHCALMAAVSCSQTAKSEGTSDLYSSLL